jgi:hypothetical protein
VAPRRKIRIASAPFGKVTNAMAIFERLSDEGGQITLGWAAACVFYARFEGTISVVLSERFAQRFTSLVGSQCQVRYFGDSGAVTSYELPGADLVIAAMLAKGEQLESIVVLPWDGALGANARALPAQFARFTFVASAAELYAQLRAAAPDMRIPFTARPRSSADAPSPDAPALHAPSPDAPPDTPPPNVPGVLARPEQVVPKRS